MNSYSKGRDYFYEIGNGEFLFKEEKFIDRMPMNIFDEFPKDSKLVFNEFKISSNPFPNAKIKNLTIVFKEIHGHLILNYESENTNLIIKDSNEKTNSLNLSIKGNINEIIIENSKLCSLSLNQIKVNKVSIKESVEVVNLRVTDSDIEEFNLNETIISNRLEFLGYRINNLLLHKSIIKHVKIDFGDVVNIFVYENKSTEVNKRQFERISTYKSKIEFFEMINGTPLGLLSCELFDCEKINIDWTKASTNSKGIANLYISGLLTNHSLITSLNFRDLYFKNFNSLETLRFENSKIVDNGNIFIIENSILSNVIFNPSFLHKFETINFRDSTIQGLQANNFVDIPTKTINPKNRDKTTNYLILFRELKGLALNYGDNYLYHKFKALEYNERLKSKEKIGVGNRIILNVNKWSNSHTTNPFKAFFGIIILIVIYIAILYSVLERNSFNEILIGNFDYLLFPFNIFIRIDSKINIPTWLLYVDFFYNFVLSFLIYQMIAAFRKFNR